MEFKALLLIFIIALLFCLLFLFCGCLDPYPPGNSHIGSPASFGPEWLDSMIEIAQAFMIANSASAPLNPYSLPVGVGLVGITAMLEALRRKEKSGRKHAEHELNSNGNNKKNPV